MNLKVEWNKAKAKNNYAKHGVSFELAKEVFHDPFAVEFLDDRQDYGEQRFVIVGAVEGQVLYVAYTEPIDAVRIISARRATKNERETYLHENS
jgi:uncharacterized DUF497 family protein